MRYDLLKILLVDDNRHMRVLAVRDPASAVGVRQIHEAGDGAQASARPCAAMPIDIIMTDLSMQPLDGIDFVRLLRRSPDSPSPMKTPVIMITGHSTLARVQDARNAGVNEFLAKPLTARAVVELDQPDRRPSPALCEDRGLFRPRPAAPRRSGFSRRRAPRRQLAPPARRSPGLIALFGPPRRRSRNPRETPQMTLRSRALGAAVLAAAGVLLSGCLAAAVVGTTVGVAGAAVGLTAKAAGATDARRGPCGRRRPARRQEGR